MTEGEDFFRQHVARLGSTRVRRQSRLPGWTCAHVIAHVSQNADAVGNLVAWAQTGIETPMYPSAEARAEAIESGSRQSFKQLVQDLEIASDNLVRSVDALSPNVWHSEVRTGRGRVIPASEIPWLRCREVWVHTLDLDIGANFDDLPPQVLERLIEEAVQSSELAERVRIVDTTTGRFWGEPEDSRSQVHASSPELAAWLLRGDSRGIGNAPLVPTWL